jgi:hypothetical protein
MSSSNATIGGVPAMLDTYREVVTDDRRCLHDRFADTIVVDA